MLTRSFFTEVPELKSNEEESYRRFVLHTKQACDSGIQNVLVVSEDTDAIALLLANADLLYMVNYFEKVKLEIVKDF